MNVSVSLSVRDPASLGVAEYIVSVVCIPVCFCVRARSYRRAAPGTFALGLCELRKWVFLCAKRALFCTRGICLSAVRAVVQSKRANEVALEAQRAAALAGLEQDKRFAAAALAAANKQEADRAAVRVRMRRRGPVDARPQHRAKRCFPMQALQATYARVQKKMDLGAFTFAAAADAAAADEVCAFPRRWMDFASGWVRCPHVCGRKRATAGACRKGHR